MFVLLEDLVDDNLVAQALRHLLQPAGVHVRAVVVLDLLGLRTNPHQAVVQPVACERLAGERLRLRQLVFMMGELQVEAAAVNVERDTQQLLAHRRAFDVPAGSARAPGAVPFRLARLGPLPQGEVAGIALLVADLDARSRLQLLRIAVAQFAVIGVLADVEIDVAARGIGGPLVDQPLDERDHVGDVLRRPRHVVDARHAETLQILDIIRRYALR